MKRNLVLTIILPLIGSCQNQIPIPAAPKPRHDSQSSNPYKRVNEIPLPAGFSRIDLPERSFGKWLRELPLKKDKTVYLYNGLPKSNQEAQFAVLDISVGREDLQQCADAVMRLRAEFLYAHGRYSEIRFCDNNNHCFSFGAPAGRRHFDDYLRKVFIHCGTLSLQRQLIPVVRTNQMQIGDVLIKGGSPGYTMIVMDMATNSKGEKIYLLAQGFMPAQDIHIVKNPMNPLYSPWFKVDDRTIVTPQWDFLPTQLRTW